jgi:hypothetical protein
VKAVLKYILSQTFCGLLLIGPGALVAMTSIFVLPQSILEADWFIWLFGGVLIFSLIAMNTLVAAPKTFRDCLREEGLA